MEIDWVSPRAGLKDVQMRSLCPRRKLNTDSPVVQPGAEQSRFMNSTKKVKTINLICPSKLGTIIFGAIATNSCKNAPIIFVVSVRMYRKTDLHKI
jgi:hypothetical protein